MMKYGHLPNTGSYCLHDNFIKDYFEWACRKNGRLFIYTKFACLPFFNKTPCMKHGLLLVFLFFPFLLAAQEQFPVYFDFDKDEASAASQEQLSRWLTSHKGAKVFRIYGYADSVGSPGYNIKLSERRAAFVEKALTGGGFILPVGAEVAGFGETVVFSENHSTDRLVMIHYYDKPAPPVSPEVEVSAAVPVAQNTPVAIPAAPTLTARVIQAKTGDRLRLPNMNFFNGMDIMVPESEPVLEELAEILQNNPSLKITIEGHICCDRLESDKLSIRRARAVYKYLITKGISRKRLDYRGYAGTSPIHFIPEKNDQEKAENRRVEIHITSK